MRTRTYRAAAFLDAASKIGIAVTVATEQAQPLGQAGSTLELDFDDARRAQAQVREFASLYPVSAVLGVDDDTTILAAQLAQTLRLPHNSVDSVKAARYKDVMRLALSEAGLPSPPFWLFEIDADLHTVARRVSFPCVVKPLALSASRGVIRADSPEELAVAFGTVASILAEADLPAGDPARQQVLIEGFIAGREVALEGLLIEGQLSVLALFDKPDPLDGPYFEETIYVTPSCLPEHAQANVADTVRQAAAALGLVTGPVHAEVRLNEAGAWVVEVAARSIGGLCSSTLRFGEGTSLEEIILRQAAGLSSASLVREQQAAGVMMIPVPAEGILRDVHGLSEAQSIEGVDSLEISIPCGERVVRPPRATRYLGFIFAHAETPLRVEHVLRAAHARLRFDISPV